MKNLILSLLLLGLLSPTSQAQDAIRGAVLLNHLSEGWLEISGDAALHLYDSMSAPGISVAKNQFLRRGKTYNCYKWFGNSTTAVCYIWISDFSTGEISAFQSDFAATIPNSIEQQTLGTVELGLTPRGWIRITGQVAKILRQMLQSRDVTYSVPGPEILFREGTKYRCFRDRGIEQSETCIIAVANTVTGEI